MLIHYTINNWITGRVGSAMLDSLDCTLTKMVMSTAENAAMIFWAMCLMAHLKSINNPLFASGQDVPVAPTIS
jgi:hypothetical protein